MKKRFLSVLCLLALLAGSLILPPASAEGEEGLRVGYGKRCITPLTPTPMGGYGDSFNRLAEFDAGGDPVFIESTGDGVIDERDGLFCSCIAVTDGNGRTILLFSYDIINCHGDLIKKLQARAAARWGIPAEYVYLNATHTHSSVDLGAYFTYVTEKALDEPHDGDVFNSSYASLGETEQGVVRDMQSYVYDVLLPGLMGAAEDAMDDRSAAGILTGSIEIDAMNFIRHYYDDINSTDPADVYGSNTRGGRGNKKHYADANHNMYLVEFVRDGKEPVVMVDWRAHATSASTGGNTYGKDNRYRLSPDYIGAFRAAMEEAGYLVSFFQGTAGNAVMGSALGSKLDEINPTDPDVVAPWTYNGTTTVCVIAPLYGRKLAVWALQALENNMSPARSGEILARRKLVYADRDCSENFKMIGGEYPDGTHVDGMLYEKVTDSQGVTRNVYQYFRTYYAYVTTPAAEKAQVNALLDKYNLNSVYHLGRINSKFTATMQKVTDGSGTPVLTPEGDPTYEYKSSTQGSFYLYSFCIGPDIGCVTAPFEIFDYPYDYRGEQFATTFVLGYTNGSDGYMPTRETYTFAGGRGAYEANNTAYAPGTAEMIGQLHEQMLAGLDRSELPATCPACGAENVQWEMIPSGHIKQSGHYYLPDDMNDYQKNVSAADGPVCLHLNGHSYINTYAATSRAFAIQSGATLNVMGDGLIQSQGVAPDNKYTSGGAILVNSGCTLNLYGGTVRYKLVDGMWIRQGGGVCVNGTMNMYGGRVEAVKSVPDAAITTEKGGAVFVGAAGAFTMTGGSLSGIEVTGEGDTLCGASGARITVGGDAVVEGGAYLPAGVSLTLTGAPEIRKGERYALYVAEGAELADISGLSDGAEIWITTDALPVTFARGATAAQAAYFRYDGAGRIAADAAGLLSAVPSGVPGDLTGDDKVNGKDVSLLQRCLAGGYGVTLALDVSDLNKDGKLNGKDVTLLQRFVAGGYGVTL